MILTLDGALNFDLWISNWQTLKTRRWRCASAWLQTSSTHLTWTLCFPSSLLTRTWNGLMKETHCFVQNSGGKSHLGPMHNTLGKRRCKNRNFLFQALMHRTRQRFQWKINRPWMSHAIKSCSYGKSWMVMRASGTTGVYSSCARNTWLSSSGLKTK